jgi:acyl carrier protein
MQRLTTVFRDIFDDPGLEIEGLSRSNFPEWDSLAHIKLILAIEEDFDVKFTIDQVSETTSVEGLAKALSEKGIV